MKILISILLLCGTTLIAAENKCCPDGSVIRPKGYCNLETHERIHLNCSYGYMPLKGLLYNDLNLPDSADQYCVGEMYQDEHNLTAGTLKSAVACFQKPGTSQTNEIETTGILTLISVVFLLLTFGVYMYLPQLRDLQGMCYMCLCISMAFGFLSLGILQLNPRFTDEICTATGFLVYFWMMATFFWVNVICINVYRTTISTSTYMRKTEKRQFFIYSVYAWGFTIIWLVAALASNFTDGDHLKPNIGGSYCWFKNRPETWAFFYGPIAVLLTANITLFVLSSYNLWKETKQYEVSKLKNLKYRFLLSLKLFLVMGISWIFEIASFAHGESHIIWRIADTFNCLQGVVIFLILVVFRKRAMKGMAKAGICHAFTGAMAEKLSPNDDSHDQKILEDDQTEVRLS